MTTGGWIFMLAWWGGLIFSAIWCFHKLLEPDPPSHKAPTEASPRE